jgi:hypothetical protein
MRTFGKVLLWLGIVIGAVLIALLVTVGIWWVRPNRAKVDARVVPASWDFTHGGLHNSNTDMTRWNGQYYIAFVSSPFHFGNSGSRLHVMRARSITSPWAEVESFNPGAVDIRDPKFGTIGDRLFVYALENHAFNPEPFRTVYSFSRDGTGWSEFRAIVGQDGWLFWRPKTRDGVTWYETAYWYEHGKAALLKSTDGVAWEQVAMIHTGARNDETEIEFLPDGRMIATARLEYDESWAEGALGDPRGSTLISVSSPPYTDWRTSAESRLTRLDGPCLFTWRGRVFALGRYQDGTGPLAPQGSCLARKRTSLFEVRLDGLARLTDLPSAGDTSYVGVVLEGSNAFASYYTSPIGRDYAWIMGMFSPTTVRMAKIDLDAMMAAADKVPSR